MSDGSLSKTLFIDYSAEMCCSTTGACPACGAQIWLVDQVTDPVSAQRELMRMGQVVNVIAFAPARGSPADFFAP